MVAKEKTITRKLIHVAGWRVVKRFAKSLPFGGTFLAIALVGDDVRNKGFLKGVVNSGMDAIPIVGIAKNAIEIFTGDLIKDKADRASRKKDLI